MNRGEIMILIYFILLSSTNLFLGSFGVSSINYQEPAGMLEQ